MSLGKSEDAAETLDSEWWIRAASSGGCCGAFTTLILGDSAIGCQRFGTFRASPDPRAGVAGAAGHILDQLSTAGIPPPCCHARSLPDRSALGAHGADHEEDEDRAEDRDQQRPQEPGGRALVQRPGPQPAADQAAEDADQGRPQAAEALSTRYEEPG